MKEQQQIFKRGDYIKYSVNRYGVTAEYIAIVREDDGNVIDEFCNGVKSCDDEDLQECIFYEGITSRLVVTSPIRKATEEEEKWLDGLIMENDRNYFDKGGKKMAFCEMN